MSLPRRLGIAGVGLLGGSIALAARGFGARVVGVEPDPGVRAYALAHGVIDETAANVGELARYCDALVLAAPVAAVIDDLHALARTLPAAPAGPAWIIDVASVKGPVAAAGAGLPNFLGTHPMAGSERQGPAAADAGLFTGKPWAYLSPAPPELERAVRAFIEAMGAVPLALDAQTHDEIVAASSHLPQTLSLALAAVIDPARLHGLHGTGLQSMLRLAASPWPMWQSIYRTNAPAIVNELRKLQRRLDGIADALDRGDDETLAALFAQAHAHVRELYPVENSTRAQ